jgi:hypothetical protein
MWGSEGIAPPFLTSALDGSEWSASRLYRFTSGEKSCDIHCIGGWVDLRSGLDAVEKSLLPLLIINPDPSADQPIA